MESRKKTQSLPRELWESRKLIGTLAKNDFRKKFAGSYLGIVWAFVQPLVMILVYWFVFQKGLQVGGMKMKAGISVPFILYLVSGLVPWFFFSSALTDGTQAFLDYDYLVKKLVFKISVLPVVKTISALFVHAFFMILALGIFSVYAYYPDLYTLQILYYSLYMTLLVLGIIYITSSVSVFLRDTKEFINVVIQIGIWVTPIMWNLQNFESHPLLVKILKLNPMYYVVAGYRDAFVNKVWFWEHPLLTVYNWVLVILLLLAGTQIFKRLKIYFADVL